MSHRVRHAWASRPAEVYLFVLEERGAERGLGVSEEEV